MLAIRREKIHGGRGDFNLLADFRGCSFPGGCNFSIVQARGDAIRGRHTRKSTPTASAGPVRAAGWSSGPARYRASSGYTIRGTRPQLHVPAEQNAGQSVLGRIYCELGLGRAGMHGGLPGDLRFHAVTGKDVIHSIVFA